MSYHPIAIGPIIDRAINMFERMSGYSSEILERHSRCFMGACGLSQACIYYAAKLAGVQEECIKLCQGSSIINGISHTFVILILDKFYLCDLSFRQFICSKTDITIGTITSFLNTERETETTAKNIDELYEKRYTELTESTLICFYAFCYRRCSEDGKHTPEISDISLELNEGYADRKIVNFMQLTISHDWPKNPDFSPKEFYEKAITYSEFRELEPPVLHRTKRM